MNLDAATVMVGGIEDDEVVDRVGEGGLAHKVRKGVLNQPLHLIMSLPT